MNKTQFDAALQEAATVLNFETTSYLIGVLAHVGLRIVPSEPVAWWDGDRSAPGMAVERNIFDKIPLFADTEDSK